MRSCYESYTTNFANSYLYATETIYCSKYLPFITAELSYARIKALASCPEVEAIGYDAEDEWDETLEPVDSPLSSTSIPPQYYTIADTIEDMGIDDIWADGAEGQSVNVGIIDVGIPNVGHTVFSGLTIYTQYAYSERPSAHASAMLEIISCMAPEATFYCTTHNSPGDRKTALEWLIENSVYVINISASFGGGATYYNQYEQGEYILDQYVSAYNVTIIKSSGNVGTTGVNPGGLSYNAIVVGDYNRYSDIINPISSYYSNNIYANKPDICAQGYFVSSFPNESTGNYYSPGTSNATAFTTGVVALLLTFRGHLREQPATVKAIVTAGVDIISTDHHYVPADFADYQQYGAGVLNPTRAYEITCDMSYLNNYCSITSDGNSHTVILTAGQTTRISLVFLRACRIYDESPIYDLSNLDLYVYDPSGNYVDSSITTNNNVEIVEFMSTTSGNYTIMVTNEYSDTITFYSISWTQ